MKKYKLIIPLTFSIPFSSIAISCKYEDYEKLEKDEEDNSTSNKLDFNLILSPIFNLFFSARSLCIKILFLSLLFKCLPWINLYTPEINLFSFFESLTPVNITVLLKFFALSADWFSNVSWVSIIS